MDVSGWTVEQRMRFPDWCFGNREPLNLERTCKVGGGHTWKISSVVWPDPACIWEVGIRILVSDDKYNYVRMGLADTLPTSEAEMNATLNILPDLGNPAYSPPRIYLGNNTATYICYKIRKGVVSDSKKLCIETSTIGGTDLFAAVHMIISGLPTSMAGWLAHNKV